MPAQFQLNGCSLRWLTITVLVLQMFLFASHADPSNDVVRLKEQVIEFRDQSKWIEALPLAEKLVTLTTNLYGEKSDHSADALHLWAWLVQENGDYSGAERLWLRALAIDEALHGKETVQTTRRLHMLANLYRDQGEYRKAAPLLHRALAIRERHWGATNPETAQVLISLGRLEASVGEFAEGEARLRRALRIFENAGRYQKENVVHTRSILGWLYFNLGDYDQAYAMMQRSLELRQQISGWQHIYTAGSLSDLGMICRTMKDYATAESLFQKSLAIRQKLFGTNHIALCGALDELGSMYLAQGEFGKAQAALDKSLNIIEKNLGPDHPQVANVLMVLSQLTEARKDHPTAHAHCRRAYLIREQHFGALHHLTLTSLRRQAHLNILLGRPEQALAAAANLQQGEENLMRNIFSFTSERQRLAFHHDSFLFQQHASLWADLGATDPLARSILRTKGVVLDSMLEDRLLARASEDTNVQQLVSRITQQRRGLAQTPPNFLPGTHLTDTNTEAPSGSQQLELLEASLARRVAGLGRARRALSVTAEEVQSVLPVGTILLEILRYRHAAISGPREDHYGVLVFSHHGPLRWIHLGRTDSLDRSIKLYQHAMRSPDAGEEVVQVLRNLYDSFWSPVISALPPNTQRVIVSPDGEWNFVSFATLLTPAHRFLGEEMLFSYVSCGRDLLFDYKNQRSNRDLSIWANPDFKAVLAEPHPGTGRNHEFPGLNFPPLPGAVREGRMLRKRAPQLGFSQTSLHVGAEATEMELYRVHSPTVLHLATHSFVWPSAAHAERPEEREAQQKIPDFAAPRANPMLRSGLALAGAEQTLMSWAEDQTVPATNDGIVTASDIATLDLRGTELVVLSSCNTGGGEVQTGEGVLGLRRAFVLAGAQNLLLTLWPVNDDQATDLILDFYASRKSGDGPWALANVQRNWLEKLRAKKGPAEACRLAGPFILSFQGKPK